VKKTRKFTKEDIYWWDAETENGWDEYEKLKEDQKREPNCITSGINIMENEDWVWLTHTISSDSYNSVIRIPKKWINRRKKTGTLKI